MLMDCTRIETAPQYPSTLISGNKDLLHKENHCTHYMCMYCIRWSLHMTHKQHDCWYHIDSLQQHAVRFI